MVTIVTIDFATFLYRFLFTLDLNDFLYTKVCISIVTIVTTSFRRAALTLANVEQNCCPRSNLCLSLPMKTEFH